MLHRPPGGEWVQLAVAVIYHLDDDARAEWADLCSAADS
jgi:hypothetical protein